MPMRNSSGAITRGLGRFVFLSPRLSPRSDAALAFIRLFRCVLCAIRGGRPRVRSVLYMATLTAMRCNPLIRRFTDRLKAKGKANKVVIVAAMRKLLTILNAMIRDRLEWSQLKNVQNCT